MEEDAEAVAEQAATAARAAEDAATAREKAEFAAAAAEASIAAATAQVLDPLHEEAAVEAKPRSRPTTGRSKAAGSRPATGRGASPAKKATAGSRPAKTGKASAATPGSGSKGGKGGRPTTTSKAAARSPSRPATAASKADSRPATGRSKLRAGLSRPATPGNLPAKVEPGGAATETAGSAKSVAVDGCSAAEAEAALAHAAELTPPVPSLRAKRYLHAFVLVRPGRREVPEALLVDPATGGYWPVGAAPCEGVEWIWDDTNYYVNLQQVVECRAAAQTADGAAGGPSDPAVPPASLLPGTSSRRLPPPGATNWDLHDPAAWAALVPAAPPAQAEATAACTTSKLVTTSVSQLHTSKSCMAQLASGPLCRSSLSPSASRLAGSHLFSPRAEGANDGDAQQGQPAAAAQQPERHRSVPLHVLAARSGALHHLGPPEHTGLSSLSYLAPEETLAQAGSHTTGPTAAAAAAAAAVAAHDGPELPLSWVPCLELSREALDVRCPRGSKVATYRQARREMFAEFGECSRWDGMVERVTTYADASCSQPLCVLELFQRRRDRLERREARPAQRLLRESFGPGALACLRSLEQVKGGRREAAFYAESRADGLLRRVEQPGESLEEYFVSGARPDRLASRVVRYAPPDPTRSAAADMAALLRRTSTLHRGSVTVLTAAAAAAVDGGGQRKSSVVSAAGLRGFLEARAVELPVAKITETFHAVACDAHRGAVDAALSHLAKRTFWLNPDHGSLKMVLRHAGGRLVARRYELDAAVLLLAGDTCGGGGLDGSSTQAGCEPLPTEEERQAEWSALRDAARQAEAAARLAADEGEGLAAARRAQELDVQLETGHCDVLRVRVEDSDEEAVGADDNAWDVLVRLGPSSVGSWGRGCLD